MTVLRKLTPYFDEDELSEQFNQDQVDELYESFKSDFINNDYYLNGKKIKISPQNSKIPEYSMYKETFAHIITRVVYRKIRVYECKRGITS